VLSRNTRTQLVDRRYPSLKGASGSNPLSPGWGGVSGRNSQIRRLTCFPFLNNNID
jgi:hypothetical protein